MNITGQTYNSMSDILNTLVIFPYDIVYTLDGIYSSAFIYILTDWNETYYPFFDRMIQWTPLINNLIYILSGKIIIWTGL